MSLKGSEKIDSMINSICERAKLEGWSQEKINDEIRRAVDQIYSSTLYPFKMYQDQDKQSCATDGKYTEEQILSIQKDNSKLSSETLTLRKEIDRLEKQSSRFHKILYACVALLLACVSLSAFAFIYGNIKYGMGVEVGYTDGYESGISDTKNIYSKPKNSGSATVYITASGSKYHEKGCPYLSDSAIPISIKSAKEDGYTACSRCHPPK